MNDDIKFRLALLRHCWNHFYRRYFKTTLVVLAMIGIIFLGGCAGIQLTEEEDLEIILECKSDEACMLAGRAKTLELKIERIEYERQEREDLRVEEFCRNAVACTVAGGTNYIETRGPTSSRRLGKCPGTDIDIIPRHTSWQCLSDAAVQELMRRAMGGY